jgi:hypothetical protein
LQIRVIKATINIQKNLEISFWLTIRNKHIQL